MNNLTLTEQVKKIQTREDFVAFIQALSLDFEVNPDEWENITVDRYLEALARWVEDISKTQVKPLNWQTVGEMFIAAKIYE